MFTKTKGFLLVAFILIPPLSYGSADRNTNSEKATESHSKNPGNSSRTEAFVGEARKESGELFYTENHKITYLNDRPTKIETIYKSEDGKKKGRLVSDLAFDPYCPPHQFKDIEANRSSSVEYIVGKSQVRVKNDKPGRSLEERVLTIDDLKVCAQGAFFFMQDNLPVFLNDDIRTLRFVVPPKLTHYGFRIRKINEDPDKDQITLRIEIDNWLFRLFAPSIEADINTKNRRLMQYRGASNLMGPGDKPVNVTIDYKYE